MHTNSNKWHFVGHEELSFFKNEIMESKRQCKRYKACITLVYPNLITGIAYGPPITAWSDV